MATSSSLQRLLTLRQLRLISVLAEELNLSRCAERLHTTQPAVSRALAQTEAAVGRQLFERTTKRIVPTAAGLSLLQHANRILAELDQAELDLRGLSSGVRGELRVGMLTVFSQAVLAQAVAQFRGLVPDVLLQVQSAGIDALYEQLLDGRIDVMLSHAELRVDLNQVSVVPLYEEHNSVVVGPGHRLLRLRRKLSWDDLAQESWVLPPPGTPLRPKLDRILSVHRHREDLAPDVETDSPLLALQLLRHTPMVWAIAGRQAELFEQQGHLRCLQAPTELLRGPMCCLSLRDSAGKTAVRLLTDCLRGVGGVDNADRA